MVLKRGDSVGEFRRGFELWSHGFGEGEFEVGGRRGSRGGRGGGCRLLSHGVYGGGRGWRIAG